MQALEKLGIKQKIKEHQRETNGFQTREALKLFTSRWTINWKSKTTTPTELRKVMQSATSTFKMFKSNASSSTEIVRQFGNKLRELKIH
jgi:DNA phosphorothioation-dependent restriction protein DptG